MLKNLCFSVFIIFVIVLYIFSNFYNSFNYSSIEASSSPDNDYIKWVEFNATLTVLNKTCELDIKSHNENYEVKYNWVELLAYLAAKYYGNFNSFKQADLDNLISKLNDGETISEITQSMDYYNFYYEAYNAILAEYVGYYEIEQDNGTYEQKYGLKVFSPIGQGYSFSHYKDFGVSRNYGYTRNHLGNDLMGSIGTPIIAMESGIVEAAGWNQYGGWRIGIRSFDGLRYYYYAHLRKDTPFNSEIFEGAIVTAGDVIGYLGMTGYSTTENVNNINVPHLHLGIQLIFDESQKEGVNQIWIDVYTIVEFLRKNTSPVYYDKETKDYFRKYDMFDSFVPD